MTDYTSSRRRFLQKIGLVAGTTLLTTSAIAGFIDKEEIRKLNQKQQEFMVRYGSWMDEFIAVIREQKQKPGDLDNHNLMIALTEKSENMKPELSEHLKDETFALIFHASIKRMSDEIAEI